MATKQATSKKNSIPAATAPARETKPKTARVTTVKHSKPVMTEAPVEAPAIENAVEKTVLAVVETSHEAIAKLAYGYWESRGFQGGNPAEDWLRAEAEYRRKP
jgi:hypothetical protein